MDAGEGSSIVTPCADAPPAKRVCEEREKEEMGKREEIVVDEEERAHGMQTGEDETEEMTEEESDADSGEDRDRKRAATTYHKTAADGKVPPYIMVVMPDNMGHGDMDAWTMDGGGACALLVRWAELASEPPRVFSCNMRVAKDAHEAQLALMEAIKVTPGSIPDEYLEQCGNNTLLSVLRKTPPASLPGKVALRLVSLALNRPWDQLPVDSLSWTPSTGLVLQRYMSLMREDCGSSSVYGVEGCLAVIHMVADPSNAAAQAKRPSGRELRFIDPPAGKHLLVFIHAPDNGDEPISAWAMTSAQAREALVQLRRLATATAWCDQDALKTAEEAKEDQRRTLGAIVLPNWPSEPVGQYDGSNKSLLVGLGEANIASMSDDLVLEVMCRVLDREFDDLPYVYEADERGRWDYSRLSGRGLCLFAQLVCMRAEQSAINLHDSCVGVVHSCMADS
jgi:hypothetical protein